MGVRIALIRLRRSLTTTRVAGRLACLLGVSALVTAAAGTQAGTSARASGSGAASPAVFRCDRSPLAPLKTLSDPQRRLVDLQPRKTTAKAINELRRPRRTPTRRNNAFARQVWRVKAVIVRDRLKDDGDVQLILLGGHSYLHAALPAPACLRRTTRARAAIVSARRRFERGCGHASKTWRDQGAVAYVSGVGFWHRPNQQPGHAKNYAGLEPVTKIKFLAGCNAEPRGGSETPLG